MSDAQFRLGRRAVLGLAGTAAALVALRMPRALAADPAGFVLVGDGTATAELVVGANPDAETTSAVRELVACVLAATGVTMPTVPAPTGTRLPVYVGRSAIPLAQQAELLDGLTDDGVLVSADPAAMVVAGPTSRGTRHALYEVAERFVGVRWLLPGDLGTDIPATRSIVVPGGTWTDEPAFRHRVMYPLGYGEWNENTLLPRFGVRQRLRNVISYGHNLNALFSPTVFGDPVNRPESYRPEFYPIRNGVTVIPTAAQKTGWQPRFTAPGIAEAAAARIIEAFEADPKRRSYSLGVNDGGGFSDDETDTSVFGSTGIYSHSEVYYRFVRDVAEIVGARFPEHTLGLLAYNCVVDPPSFALPDNVVPFVTRDRYRWATPQGAQSDREMLTRWRAVCRHVGLYDYSYGHPYVIPRLHSRATAQAYRWATEQGFTEFFAESNPLWGNGSKEWVQAKLLWNPTLDPDRLAAEWAHRAAGGRAAPHILGYERIWDEIWTKRVPQTEWFRAGLGNMYFWFFDSSYLDVVTDADIAAARAQLDQALAKTTTAAQRWRVEEIRTAFAYHEASALSHPRRPEPVTSDDQARDLWSVELARVDSALDWAARRQQIVSGFASDPMRGSRYATMVRVTWSGWNCFSSWEVGDWLRTRPVLRAELAARRATTSENQRRWIDAALAIADGRLVQAGTNRSFESGDTTGWSISYGDPLRDPLEVTSSVSVDGGNALRYPGGQRGGGIMQVVPVQPGFFRSDFAIRTNPGDWAGGAVVTTWIVRDADGKALSQVQGAQLALELAKGRWRRLVHADVLPEGAATVEVYCSILFMPGQADLWVDDVHFTQLDAG